MPIDASIYQNSQPTPVKLPDPMEAIQGVMSLRQLGMQYQTQNAVRDAYAANTDPQTGQLNQQGFLAHLGKLAPYAVPQYQQQFAAMNKQQADADAAKADAAEKTLTVTGPAWDYLAGLPEDKRPQAYPGVIKQIADKGIDTSHMPADYDPGLFQQAHDLWTKSKPGLESVLAQANASEKSAQTEKAYAEAAKVRSETPNGLPGGSAQVDDPAQLVPRKVPQNHQTKALEEIKNAQDIQSLTPKIVAAFQMGSSRNPIVAKQGQQQFEGLINTTVKETEGTARQAAFDSIHKTMTPSGLLAVPGENEAKLNTVLSYLRSKAAAPTNKAYGIDLTKFSTTGPYNAPKKDQGDGSGVPGVASAGAADKPPSAHDQSALQWVKDPKNASSPQAFKIRALLKAKGLL